MLINTPAAVHTVKLPFGVNSPDNRYPHFRLYPLFGQDGRYCLFCHITPEHYLILEADAPRSKIIAQLGRILAHAPYSVFEHLDKP